MTRPALTGSSGVRGRRQLDEAAALLAPRDWAVLTDLERFRLADSTQIRRLHFGGHASPRAAVRATNQALRRLAAIGLIDHLDARIGGPQGGSSTYVWHLTPAGARLLARRRAPTGRAPVRHEPTPRMAAHTLACTETAVRLREQVASGRLELLALETEPDCWRDWLDPTGIRHLLKPDLFTVTAATGAEFEQLWFVEIDRDSESVATLAGKAAVYGAYQASGQPIRRHGAMPRVAWIVPDTRRAQVVARATNGRGGQPGLHEAMTLERFIATVTEQTTPAMPTATSGTAADPPGGQPP